MNSGDYKTPEGEFAQCELCGVEYPADSLDRWRLVTFDNGVAMQVCEKCADVVKDCTTRAPIC